VLHRKTTYSHLKQHDSGGSFLAWLFL